MLNFTVTLRAGEPIYEQIILSVKRAVVTGQLKVGDKFPSVREMSKELNINPNTAQKVVTALTLQGILEIHPGVGAVVRKQVPVSAKEVSVLLLADIERLIIEARKLGASKGVLLDAIEKNWQLDAEAGKRK